MNSIDILVWGIVALGTLGLLIAGAGAVWVMRQGRSRRRVGLLVLGLVLLAAGSGLAWYNRPLLLQKFAIDQVDPDLKARLGEDSIGPPERPDNAGAEWPQWRGPLRDGISPATGLATVWPKEGPRVVSRRPIHGGYSSIAVAGGRLYTQDRVAGHERVICLGLDGKELWVHRYQVEYGKLEYAAGPRATPTVHDGRVYTVGATGVFLCLEANPAGGKPKVLWRHDLLEEFKTPRTRWGVACSPLVEGGLVIVQPGGEKGSVAAFDCVSGELAWAALDDEPGYSSPVAVTAAGVRQIIALTGTHLAGLRPGDGSVLWRYPWPTNFNANAATPVVAGDYVFISSDYGAGCALLHLGASGEGGVKATPVFVKHDKLMRNQYATCVQHGDHLYGFDVPGHGGSGILKCIHLRTFEEKWRTRDLEKGSLICAGDRLLVLTQSGSLVLVPATPEGYSVVSEVQVLSGGECWAPPALAGGLLYVRDGEEIVCLDLRN